MHIKIAMNIINMGFGLARFWIKISEGPVMRDTISRPPCIIIIIPYLSQMCHEGDALHCLTQTHLVGQNPVDALVVQVSQPVHPLQLVSLQLPAKYTRLGELCVGLEHGRGQAKVLVNCKSQKACK